MIGLLLHRALPEHHLDNESKDTVNLALGLIATLSVIVLGLLVSTAKSSFDRVNGELTQGAANVVELDRVLGQYGPETKDIRDQLKGTFSTAVEAVISGDQSQLTKLDTPQRAAQVENIAIKILALTPQNDGQRLLQRRALELNEQMSSIRWLVVLQLTSGVPRLLLVVLITWFSIIFIGWGLFAPRNPTVRVALLTSAVCVSGAIFLMLELERPLTGFIRISDAPLRAAISHLGH